MLLLLNAHIISNTFHISLLLLFKFCDFLVKLKCSEDTFLSLYSQQRLWHCKCWIHTHLLCKQANGQWEAIDGLSREACDLEESEGGEMLHSWTITLGRLLPPYQVLGSPGSKPLIIVLSSRRVWDLREQGTAARHATASLPLLRNFTVLLPLLGFNITEAKTES